MVKHVDTEFAPASRTPAETVESQRKLLANYYSSIQQLFDAVSEIILIVNQQRQIVFFNAHAPAALGVKYPELLYGLRPGEAIKCMYACNSPGGCGTSKYCSQCGAVQAILSALSNKAESKECRISRPDSTEAFDFLIRTTPLEVGGYLFSIVAITDISHEKRRRVLERIFFHDIMNTAMSISIFANMLAEDPKDPDADTLRANMLLSSKQLLDELRSHKDLLAAENNELETTPRPIDAYLLLKEVVEVLARRNNDHSIVLERPAEKVMLHTDYGILSRVISNMIINAVEASKPHQPITVSFEAGADYVEFKVHNHAVIPAEVQLQLFQRSFTTKGSGRGLGTYSMKLLSHRYLRGTVSFTSSPETGTTFIARYPR